ncbi:MULTISPECIES: restriction endonuclease [Gammaproteobacteria]|uniref:restriction endonuclease n=1 Tax=Gammaproteobacteria TaxID=1236 RepID=UPI001912C60F|nr:MULTISPECIES: restriction endonuclease [Gammaproteobacteria]MBK5303799.1 restriction endonuclease [Bacillus sp. TH86]MBK5323568.1 restriction endonuclease [Bacillus sp. TH59]MBK5338518.1 restriction endonuclease [Bacillus sp. TH57]MBK5312573.1 restriction endonuclease [Pseudomonas sp. TH71]MBK5318066.1 restriction endonuclease [Erwinia sp. TH79]
MAIWLVRAGSTGEFEDKFIGEGRVYLTWDRLDADLSGLKQREHVQALLTERYPDAKAKTLQNWSSQIWPFAQRMQIGDWVVLPLKTQPVVYIGEIVGDYQFAGEGPTPFFHWRTVSWIGEAIPRSYFSQDLLYSFGAFMTICRVQRNNAEARLKSMGSNGWQPETLQQLVKDVTTASDEAAVEQAETDLERTGKDHIVRLIEGRFKGHRLTTLVAAILRAQGFSVWQSPEGADGGVDILASSGVMGFGEQTICVEVKSGTGLVDRPTVDKLLGSMSKFNASQGLFVAWGGYRSNVQKELASSFFRLRLWNQNDLLEQLFLNYDRLDESIKSELPLKRIWTVALTEDA